MMKNKKEIKRILVEEAYQALLNNLLYAKDNNKVIAVTSSTYQENKSNIIANLSRRMTCNDKKILLIDCDNRNSQIDKIFRISNDIGVSNLKSLNGDYSKLITQFKGIDIVTSGEVVGCPSITYASKEFMDFMEYSKLNYDYILLDTPPILDYSDIVAVSKYIDGILLVACKDVTSKVNINDAIKVINSNNMNLIGSIFSGASYRK